MDDDEEVLGPKVPYLSAIGALMYIVRTIYTRPDIAFIVNLLTWYSGAPTRRHWVGVKTIPRYLQGTQDLGLWSVKNQVPTMAGYVDAGYMSDLPIARLQTSFVFLCGGASISWQYVKADLGCHVSQPLRDIRSYAQTDDRSHPEVMWLLV
jgi:hypothetical protein